MKRAKAPIRKHKLGGINDSEPPENPHEALITVTYWAISILSSRTVWLNLVALFIATLSLTEIVTIVPVRLMGTYSAVVAILNLILRTMTVRPVAFVAPGETKPIEVKRIDPPAPAVMSD